MVEKKDKNADYVAKLRQLTCPVIIVINKIDLSDQPTVLKLIAERFEEGVPYGEGDTLVRIADMTDEFVAAKTEMIEKGLLVKIDGKIFRK